MSIFERYIYEDTFYLKQDKDGSILCPQCGKTFIHIVKTTSYLTEMDALHFDVKTDSAFQQKIESSLIELIHETKLRGGRDYSIDLHYVCEEGCKGIIRFRHHEGCTYIEHEPSP